MARIKRARIKNGYKYLHGQSISNLSPDRIAKLKNECEKKQKEYKDVERIVIKDMWLKDLDNFEKSLTKFEHEAEDYWSMEIESNDTKKQKKRKYKD